MRKVMLGICLFLSVHAEDVTVVCPYFWTTGRSMLTCTITAARLKSCKQGQNDTVDFQWSAEQSTPVVACRLDSGNSSACSSTFIYPGCRCTKGNGNETYRFEFHNVSLANRSLVNTSWKCVISCDGALGNPLSYSRSEGCSSVKLVQSWASALNVPNFPEFEFFSSTIIRVELNANVQNAGTCDAGIYNQLVMYLVKSGGQEEILCHQIYSNHDNTSKTIYQAELCVCTSVTKGIYAYDLQLTTDPHHDGAQLIFKSICLDNSRSYVFPQFYRIKNVFPWWFSYLYAVLITSAIVIFIPFSVIIYIALNFPIFITRPLCDVTVMEKEPITLKCKLTRPGVPVKWYFGIALLQNSPDFRLESTGRKHCLKIESADLSHDGIYRVEVNGMSSSAKVTVEEDELDELLDDLIFEIDSCPQQTAIAQTPVANINEGKEENAEKISATILHNGQGNIEQSPNFNKNESNSDSQPEQAARKKSTKSDSQTRQATRKKSSIKKTSKTGSLTDPQGSKTSSRAGLQTYQMAQRNSTTTTNNKAKVDPENTKIDTQTEMVSVQEPSRIPEKEEASTATDPPSECLDEKTAKNIAQLKMVSSAIDETDDADAFMQSAAFWEEAKRRISWKELKDEDKPLDSSSFFLRRNVSFSSSISTFYVRLLVEIIGHLQPFMLAALVLLVLCSGAIAYIMFAFFFTDLHVVPTGIMMWCVTTLNLNIFDMAFIIGSLIFYKKGHKRHRIKWFWDRGNAYERPVEKKLCCGWFIYSFGQESKKTIYEIMLEDMTFFEKNDHCNRRHQTLAESPCNIHELTISL